MPTGRLERFRQAPPAMRLADGRPRLPKTLLFPEFLKNNESMSLMGRRFHKAVTLSGIS